MQGLISRVHLSVWGVRESTPISVNLDMSGEAWLCCAGTLGLDFNPCFPTHICFHPWCVGRTSHVPRRTAQLRRFGGTSLPHNDLAEDVIATCLCPTCRLDCYCVGIQSVLRLLFLGDLGIQTPAYFSPSTSDVW